MSPIYLDLGEPGYAPPEDVPIATAEAALTMPMAYAPPWGLPELREAIAAQARQRHHLPVSLDGVVVTVGASMGIFAALAATAHAGESVLIPNPGYPAYRTICGTLNLLPCYYHLPASAGFIPNFAAMQQQVTERTRALIWNFPANPTGRLATATLEAHLADFIERNNLILIRDEAYESLVYADANLPPHPARNKQRTISVFSFSKTYALSGWRVGFAIAPTHIATDIAQTQWAIAMSPPTIGQIAALACLQSPAQYRANLLDFLRANRDRAIDVLAANGVPHYRPDGGLFIWADISHLTDDDHAFTEALWRETRVAVTPGQIFGTEGRGHIRILFGTGTEQVVEGLSRLGHFYHHWAGVH